VSRDVQDHIRVVECVRFALKVAQSDVSVFSKYAMNEATDTLNVCRIAKNLSTLSSLGSFSGIYCSSETIIVAGICVNCIRSTFLVSPCVCNSGHNERVSVSMSIKHF